VKIFGALPTISGRPRCLIAALAEPADVAHLNLASPSSPTQIPAWRALPNQQPVVDLLSWKICSIIFVGSSEGRPPTGTGGRPGAPYGRSGPPLEHIVGGSAGYGSRLSGLDKSRIAGLIGASQKQTQLEERLSARCSS
jgi:hypothetical protein